MRNIFLISFVLYSCLALSQTLESKRVNVNLSTETIIKSMPCWNILLVKDIL